MELPPPNSALAATTKEERTWAMAAHLSGFAICVFPTFGNVIAPLVIWMLKKDALPLVNDQAKEALNFQITYTLAFMVAGALVIAFIGILLLPLLGIAWLILMIIAAVKANEGVAYRYPAILRLVK